MMTINYDLCTYTADGGKTYCGLGRGSHLYADHFFVQGRPESDFNKVFTELEAPEYPATCDQCGAEGTNASMEGHICDESHSLKSLSALLKDPSYMTLPRARQIAIKHAHWNATTLPNNEFALSWQDTKVLLDANTVLIEQRERLLQAAKFALSTPGLIRGRDELQRIVDEVLATIEQETEVKSNTSGEAGR